MPASLYGLVGRQHHAQQPVAGEENVAAVATVDVVDESAVIQIEQSVEVVELQQPADQVIVEESATVTEDEVTSEPESAAPVYPEWDASWTKTKLLGIATELGLAVTIDSAKSDIVSALTAATRS